MRQLYTIERHLLHDVMSMYEREVAVTRIGILTFDIWLTAGQVEELNAIGIFPITA